MFTAARPARSALLGVLFAWSLTACAGPQAGHLATLPEGGNAAAALTAEWPWLTDDAVIADDGAVLPLRRWLPTGPVKAVVLALHGVNDYSHEFAAAGNAWAKQGIATYAYDQRGFGQAPLRGSWAGARRLDQDAALASRLLHERYPGVPLYLLGDSMGGAVVITAVAGVAGADRPLCDGIVLVAPAVWGRETMNVFERASLWMANQLFPGMTVSGGGLGIEPSDNIEMLRAQYRDPLVIKAMRIDTLNGVVDLMDLALDAAPHLSEPMLLLYGERDEVIPPEPIRRFIVRLPPAAGDKQRIALYPDGYHMLLRDLGGPQVMRDVASWIADREAPLSSEIHRRSGRTIAARD
jgi:alpha-beta hydrolase superfamily lysophospholipase